MRHFQPLTHDAVEDQRHEADHGVSTYALRQSVIHRGKFDLRFQDSEAALDVGQTLVALHDRLRVGNPPLEPRGLEVEFFPKEEVLHEKVKIYR